MSSTPGTGSSPQRESSTSSSTSPAEGDAVLTPASLSSPRNGRESSLELDANIDKAKMEKDHTEDKPAEEQATKADDAKEKADTEGKGKVSDTGAAKDSSTAEDKSIKKEKVKKACKKHEEAQKRHNKRKGKAKANAKTVKSSSKKKAKVESDSDSDSSDDSESDASSSPSASDSDSDDSDDSASDAETAKNKKKLLKMLMAKQQAQKKKKAKEKEKEKAKTQKAKKKEKASQKAKKNKKSKKYDLSSDSSSSEADALSDASDSSDSSPDIETIARRALQAKAAAAAAVTKKTKLVTVAAPEAESASEVEDVATQTLEAEAETLGRIADQVSALQYAVHARQLAAQQQRSGLTTTSSATRGTRVIQRTEPLLVVERSSSRKRDKSKKEKALDKKGKAKKGNEALEFKRVDQVWDTTIHAYKCQESAESPDDEFHQFVFTVRRRFNWENKYRDTVVDIKSKTLREALQELMKDVKSVSLVEEQPCLDPNMLFLYLEEMREFYKKTLKARIKKEKKRKRVKHLTLMRAQVKVMIDYLDEDYAETKKTLYPLIEAGNITFEYLWALFKPNTIAYTTTYGTADEPRCFKVDYAYKESNFIKGEWYSIEGRYLEYDGKHFGMGEFEAVVDSFKGPRKITSLSAYPLQYHKEPEKVKQQLLERGKKFVMMQGMNYKFQKGLAYQKKKNGVAKVNINGRVMIDPAIFRRINPNYRISIIKPKDADELEWDDDSDGCSDCGCGSDEEREPGEERESKPKVVWRVIYDKDDEPHIVQVPLDENGEVIRPEKLEQLPNGDAKDAAKSPRLFSEEELLIASPVVLGFSFNEKLWLEFTLSGIGEIEWNDSAFESLVLPPNQKSIVRALVSSHKFHAAETIDDVVQGKGKGLVFVLHGGPGLGKTLTGEGIAEMLRCPLYMVSAGELGTDYRTLEHELQKIMDIAHSWGAVLLLDEADVFLEKRQIHDIGRNALVSIFLRILEYFQGILFLTTNRVETFDEAFQSRIHVALRYEELGHKAKREIWKMFLVKVKDMEGTDMQGFSDRDLDFLARHKMNGRQIKNAVKTAQALAVNEKKKLCLEHIERVLAVAESFDRDLRGLTLDAMKSYI